MNQITTHSIVRSFIIGIACWMIPSIVKADTPIPTQVVSSYDASSHRLTVTVKWYWTSQANNKHVGAAVFADLNGDGITPTIFSDPATYTSGGNPFPAGLQARDEFLGQLAVSNIEGSASSSLFAGSDRTDNGIASGVPGVTPTTARMLMPYLGNSIAIVNASGSDVGTFTLTYDNVPVSPSQLCVILYDPHSPFTATGGHSVVSAGPNHNTDNSLEDGNDAGTVSCNTLTTLNCAQNKTEASCQTQAAINASYQAWLNSVTASGCNGTLTNNSTGAPSACGGSKTVTWTYTQTGCPNQAQTTTCTATFTVIADNTKPVFTSCPSGANLGCNPSGTIPPAGNVTATDNCGNNNVTITHSLGPVVVNGNQRTQTRTYTATDVCGNSSTCEQVFTWTNCGLTNPDFNVTYVNVSVTGNVNTNDKVPSGTTYSNPALTSSPAGSTQTITMNTDGTYSFIANMPGVYVYNVTVCAPGVLSPCPTEKLTITVLNPNVNTNPPVANPDIAFTRVNVPVLIKTLANDRAGNPGGTLNPASVTVTTAAVNGSSFINGSNGDNFYVPNSGFTGWDELTYQVCDNSVPPLCATAKQYIYVWNSQSPNTTFAADDYAYTPMNTAVSGNVKTNDSDPEGNAQTVTSQTIPVPGKGTLVLAADGSYTFTPVTGFTGPVNFIYTTCDNGAPMACASATLYILVSPAPATPNLTPIIEYLPSITHGTQQISVVTTVAETKGVATNGVITVYVARDPKYSIIWNPAATSAGGKAINNSVWTLNTSNPGFYIFTTSSVIAGNGFLRFGFDVMFNPNNSNGTTTITTTIQPNSGGESTSDANDNFDSDVLKYFIQ